MSVTDYMEAYRVEPEYVHTHDDYVPLRIEVSAMGGGTLGKSYVRNRWIYRVWEGDDLVLSGDDLMSPLRTSHYRAAYLITDTILSSPDYEDILTQENRDQLESISDEIFMAEHNSGVDSHDCDYACDAAHI